MPSYSCGRFVAESISVQANFLLIRLGSATTSLSIVARCKVCFKYLLALHSIFWSNPSKYSNSFFITRNIGALHALVSK